MIQNIWTLSKHSLFYGLGSITSSLLGFILLPIYTYFLTPTDYGILTLLGVTGSIAGTIAGLGLGSALFREVIHLGTDESTVENTALYFLIGESILFFGVLIAFSPQLSNLIFNAPQYTFLLRLIFFTGILNVFNIVTMARLRIREQSALYAILSVARFIVGAGLNIYYITVLQRGVKGLIIAGLIASVLFAIVYIALLFRDLRPTFSIQAMRRMLNFGTPLVPAGLASMVMTSADLYFLKAFSTSAEVGLYSLGYQIGMVINLIVGAIQMAWPAQMFTIAKQQNAERQFAKMLTYYLVALGFIGLLFSVLAREALMLMTTPRFYKAYTVVPLIVLSYIFYGVRFMTNIALPTQNKMKYMPPIIISAAVLNIGLNYLFIPCYGMMGAAWATVISYLILVLVQTAVNQHFWYIRYEYRRIGKIVLICGIMYGSSLLIRTPNIWFNAGLKLLLLSTYPLLLYMLRFFENQELVSINQLFRSGMHRVTTWRIGL